MDTEAFQSLVSHIDYPMFIVTAASANQRSGCLVGFVTQASIDPPRLLVLLSKVNHTYRVARDADELVVHFLHEGNLDLAQLFGEQTGDRTDKFARCSWEPTRLATPIVAGTMGWVSGRILTRTDTGDHVAHLLEPTAAHFDGPERQLGFQAVTGLEPGHPA